MGYNSLLTGDFVHLEHDLVLELRWVTHLNTVELDFVALLYLLRAFGVRGVGVINQLIEDLLLLVDRVGEAALSAQFPVHTFLDAFEFRL